MRRLKKERQREMHRHRTYRLNRQKVNTFKRDTDKDRGKEQKLRHI